MHQKRAYCYRCYPTLSQRQILARTFGCARFDYNWGLRLRTEAYRARGEHVFYRDTSAALTHLKQDPAYGWLHEVSSVPPQQALRHAGLAPFAPSLTGGQSIRPSRRSTAASRQSTPPRPSPHDGSALTLARMQEALPIRWSRPLPRDAKPSTITVSRDPAGRYFVSFLVTEDIAPLPSVSNTVGIDPGLEDVVTLSTGEKTGNERFFRQEEKRLARAQRRHAKKQKGSKNREKARRKVARIHARIANRRRDFQHKLATRLIRPEPAWSASSRWPSKTCSRITVAACAIADVGWGELLRMLSYKASWYGRTRVSVNRWYPSSKRCSACGHELESLSLAVREWTCPKCGAVHDRDVNAARNTKAEGLITPSPVEAGSSPNLNGKGGKARSGEAGRSLSRGGESHHLKADREDVKFLKHLFRKDDHAPQD